MRDRAFDWTSVLLVLMVAMVLFVFGMLMYGIVDSKTHKSNVPDFLPLPIIEMHETQALPLRAEFEPDKPEDEARDVQLEQAAQMLEQSAQRIRALKANMED